MNTTDKIVIPAGVRNEIQTRYEYRCELLFNEKQSGLLYFHLILLMINTQNCIRRELRDPLRPYGHSGAADYTFYDDESFRDRVELLLSRYNLQIDWNDGVG